METRGITSEQMYESMARMQVLDGENTLMCMDYLLAAVEYFEFVSMMLDAKVSLSPPSHLLPPIGNFSVR